MSTRLVVLLITITVLSVSAASAFAQDLTDSYKADQHKIVSAADRPRSSSIENAVAPSNDNFESAETIAMGANNNSILTRSTTAATKQPNEPNHGDNVGGSSVWFNFTPTITGAVEIRTISNETDFDTTLGIYKGDTLESLMLLGTNDDCYRVECGVRSRVRVYLQAGTTYRIAVDGYNNGSSTEFGTFKLIMEGYSSPFEYDDMETAYDLGLTTKASIGGTNHLATGQVGEPSHSNGNPPPGKSVWYRFQVPSTRAMTITLHEDFRAEIAVYASSVANPTFAQLNKVDDSNDHTGYYSEVSELTFLAASSTYYFVAIDWNNTPAGAQTGNFQLRIFPTKMKYGIRFDDWDDFSSLGVFRPSDATWYCIEAHSNSPVYKKFGLVADIPVPADYDGDALTNFAVTRNVNGAKHWYILRQDGTGYFHAQWGLSTDKEVVGDFDRDGRADVTALRNQNGTLVWYVRQSSNLALRTFVFGLNGDRPVLGDFDGDGATEVTVVRDTPGGDLEWHMLKSNGNQSYLAASVQAFGQAGDLPVAEDFDGDGKSDKAVFRPSNSTWYIIRSGSGQLQVTPFGTPIDKPQPADYNRDGKADLAVFRPTTGVWYIWFSGSNTQKAVAWGKPGDKPVASMARFSLPEADK